MKDHVNHLKITLFNLKLLCVFGHDKNELIFLKLSLKLSCSHLLGILAIWITPEGQMLTALTHLRESSWHLSVLNSYHSAQQMFVCFMGIININNDAIWLRKHFPLIVNAHCVDKNPWGKIKIHFYV
jgi:hypothetical protein